jgi:hypothetical protein
MAVLAGKNANPKLALEFTFNVKDIEFLLKTIGTSEFKGTEIRQAFETISKLELMWKKLQDNDVNVL